MYEKIKQKLENGEEVKIHTADMMDSNIEKPFFMTGLVRDAYKADRGYRVNLQPLIGMSVRSGCGNEGLFGNSLKDDGVFYWDGILIPNPDEHWRIATDSFEEHKKIASRMMINSVCKKETDAFKKYLEVAKELKLKAR